jgi:hypothetical protein
VNRLCYERRIRKSKKVPSSLGPQSIVTDYERKAQCRLFFENLFSCNYKKELILSNSACVMSHFRKHGTCVCAKFSVRDFTFYDYCKTDTTLQII